MAVNRIAGNLAPYLRLGPGHTLLDIGCGSGRHLKSIQIETGCHAEGLDFEIRDELLQKFSAPPLTLRRGDFLSYDFGEQRYDVVYAAHLIEHVADPIAFLRKIDSILKPGGVCVLETPNEDCLGARLFGSDWGGNHIPRHWFLPNPRSAEVMVKRAAPESLTLLKVKFIPITFVIWSLHSFLVTRGFKRLADVLFPSDDRYMKTTPVNLMRHGLAHAVSRLEGLITGKTSCMITVIGKRNAANATP
jgi:SAM-dependent methyltransferase